MEPVGIRGIAHVIVRASDYGMRMQEYAEGLAENLTVICMIETPEGVENAEEIAAVQGLSMIFIGPFDLSTSMGISGQFENPEFRAALDRIETAAKRAGVMLGTIATTCSASSISKRQTRLGRAVKTSTARPQSVRGARRRG